MSGDPKFEGAAATLTTIAEMPAWYMWAAPEILGSTDEETDRACRGMITPERFAELRERSQKAFVALRDAEPGSQRLQ